MRTHSKVSKVGRRGLSFGVFSSLRIFLSFFIFLRSSVDLMWSSLTESTLCLMRSLALRLIGRSALPDSSGVQINSDFKIEKKIKWNIIKRLGKFQGNCLILLNKLLCLERDFFTLPANLRPPEAFGGWSLGAETSLSFINRSAKKSC